MLANAVLMSVCLSATAREIDSMHQEPNLPNWPLSAVPLSSVLAFVQCLSDKLNVVQSIIHSLKHLLLCLIILKCSLCI